MKNKAGLFQKECQKVILDQLKTPVDREVKLFSDDSIRLEYALIVRPSRLLIKKILKVLEKIKKQFPNQFYYSSECFHLTILGQVYPETVSVKEFIKAAGKVIKKYPFTILMKGLVWNIASVAIPGYPGNDDIHFLRQELRERFREGPDYTIFHSVWEHLTWLNTIRYLEIPQSDFFKVIQQFQDYEFGEIISPVFELYLNKSKTFNPEGRKLLQVFKQ